MSLTLERPSSCLGHRRSSSAGHNDSGAATQGPITLRDQPIDDTQQIGFSRYFGPVAPAHPIANGLREKPEVKVNTLEEGRQKYGLSGSMPSNPSVPSPARALGITRAEPRLTKPGGRQRAAQAKQLPNGKQDK